MYSLLGKFCQFIAIEIIDKIWGVCLILFMHFEATFYCKYIT